MTIPYVIEIGLGLATIGLAIVGFFGWKQYQLSQEQYPRPPVAPYTLMENVRRTGWPSLPHKVECTEWVEDNCKQDTTSGATFALRLPLPWPFVTTADYKLGRLVLSGSADGKVKEADKSPSNKNLNLVPNVYNLLSYPTADPDRAKARKFIAPSFSTANLQKNTLEVLYTKTVQLMANRLTTHTEGDDIGGKRSVKVNMKEENVAVIFDVLAESLFDLPMNKGSGGGSPGSAELGSIEGFSCDNFRKASDASLKEAVAETNNPLRWAMFWSTKRQEALQCRDQMVRWGHAVLERHRAKGSATNQSTILGHLMTHNYPSEQHRVSDLIVLLIAGHETTAHSLSFLLLCLARSDNRHALLRLQAELDAAFPALNLAGAAFSEEAMQATARQAMTDCSYSAVCGLPYFTACLKECQRLYPVAPVVGRQLGTPIVHNGMLLPKNTVVAVHLFAMGRQRWIHRREEFLPERWLEDHAAAGISAGDSASFASKPPLTADDTRKFTAELPALKELDQINTFSTGKRSCVGQNLAILELRVMGALLLRNLSFELVEEPPLELAITLKPAQLPMKISQRR